MDVDAMAMQQCNNERIFRLCGLTGSVHVLRLEVQVKPTMLFPVSEAITLTFGIPLSYLYLHDVSG
jgi:hypothetical protein